MKILNIPVNITPAQCGRDCHGGAADLTAYLLDPMNETADRLRPAVIICSDVYKRQIHAWALAIPILWRRNALL